MMVTRYVIDSDGIWTGETVEWMETQAIPERTVSDAPPVLYPGEYALWVGAWAVVNERPQPPEEPELAGPTPQMVDAERDRRIAAGFVFAGKLYQSRPEDRENISGAALAALAAQIGGAQSGDLRWHGGDSEFVWIAADNSLTPMDAHTMFAFGQAAMAHKQAHIFAARAVKDAVPIPADYEDDGYWP